MPVSTTYLPYSETGYFSALVTDYLSGGEKLHPFYTYEPSLQGIEKAIGERNKYPVNRTLLAATLERQYKDLEQHEAVTRNISLLANDNTYTVCTAHQPNLLTGYLYFIYKIVHAIKLAEELNTRHPDKHFVPVYYMGSEDNDLDELGTFRYEGKKFVWDGDGQSGAVGRMQSQGLKPLLQELFKLLGPPGEHCDRLKDLLQQAYLEQGTIAAATRYLVNELLGKYGLLVLDPDDAGFKKEILPIMQDDLLHQAAQPIVAEQAGKLAAEYKAQAYPRPINLFYLHDQLRERIEKDGDKWLVVNTGIEWTKEELLEELNNHPERFSPNVILRGLLQESILPNIAFIGGGAEVAYWLQLKPLFDHYQVFYPPVLLRQSMLFIGKDEALLKDKIGLETADLFRGNDELIKEYLAKYAADEWQTTKERSEIEQVFEQLAQKAEAIDSTLSAAAKAALARMNNQLENLEKKMLRAEKRKMDVQVKRIERLRERLFPRNSLQERTENFIEYFVPYGPAYFDILKDAIDPSQNAFIVLEDKE